MKCIKIGSIAKLKRRAAKKTRPAKIGSCYSKHSTARHALGLSPYAGRMESTAADYAETAGGYVI